LEPSGGPCTSFAFHNEKDPIMSESPKDGLDRRDFMIASIATVGASAVLARNAGPAKAQDTSTSSGDATSGESQRTVYTGDVIEGKKVVSVLDLTTSNRGGSTFCT
jgi:hypothetical protein